MRQIEIDLSHNDEALDWSIEINGLRNEHVTSETIEALVECELIVGREVIGKRSNRGTAVDLYPVAGSPPMATTTATRYGHGGR
jgi:hypothetical protein